MYFAWILAKCPVCQRQAKVYVDVDQPWQRQMHHHLILCTACIKKYRPDSQMYMMDLDYLNEQLKVRAQPCPQSTSGSSETGSSEPSNKPTAK